MPVQVGLYLSLEKATMKVIRSYGIVLAVVLAVPLAKADQVSMTFTGTLGNTTLTITNSSLGTVTAIIDPYLGTINGKTSTIWCVDPDHEITKNESWTANVSTLGDLSNTRLGAGAATIYSEMAWLITQFMSANTANQQAIQYVIWWLADNTLTAAKPSGLTAQQWADLVNYWKTQIQNPNNRLTSGFEILTDTNASGNGAQEFILLTPEAGTLVLLGFGLLGVLALYRRNQLRA